MPSLLRNGGSQDDDRLIQRFLHLWETGTPSLTDFWHELDQPENLVLLAGLIKIDIRQRFDRGLSVTARDYLDQFPELVEDDQRVISLVYEEFCLREEQGEDLDVDRFCDPYDRWRDSLLSQLGYHRQLSQVSMAPRTVPRYPKPGERFSDYTLDSILGRGGSAQVYLATDEKLDRQVVLKITGAEGREASILAHLQHPNIVSVLSKIDSAETGLKGFSMLYCPGITLDRLIKLLRTDSKRRSARELRDLLRTVEVQSGATPSEAAGWKDFPIHGTYYDAMVWITLRLADALTYAHREKILHRDVKPANILLAFSDGPKLFDFNLAADPRSAEQARAAQTGGTLPYMAPEQLHAFVDPRGWEQVGGPADVYSLGLVLREVITGKPPETPDPSLPLARGIQELLDLRCKPPASVRADRPDVPPALDSILGRCLEPSLHKRYRSSKELAEDLHRFLERRPLKHAPNTSIREWAINLFNRNRPVIFGAVGILLVLIVGWIAGLRSHQPFHLSPAFRAAVADMDAGRYDKAEAAFTRFDRDHFGSGYAKLYLALTLAKAGKDGFLLERLQTDLPQCHDAKDAIQDRLKTEPGSAFLLTELGWWYRAHQREDEAREVLQDACKKPDASHVAFGILSDIEMTNASSLKTTLSSLDHLNRAIELARREGHQASRDLLSSYNQSYLARLIIFYRQLDKEPLSDQTVAMYEDLFRKVEMQFRALDFPWSEPQVRKMRGTKEFCFNFYGGLVALGRARIERIRGKPSAWTRQVELARKQLHHAWRLTHEAETRETPNSSPETTSGESPSVPFDQRRFLEMLQGLGVKILV